MTMTEDEKIEDAMRRFGWLRLDEDGVERMHNHRDTGAAAMAAYKAYAAKVREEREREE